ncbi:unnamed protein product [Eruca vesicaria subsp. sativa]|uniref:Uncharacterized protein n=1 Tax=Eruca vesicaria subsp. sativa TaxID=29727 RepID=A0ABC8JAW0_ERUVS|nr:unnamed protein product [Eruca vesicaria subsp. sativa]
MWGIFCNQKTSKRKLFIRSLIREVAGFATYEKRITELLNVGKDKRSELSKLPRESWELTREPRGRGRDVFCPLKDEISFFFFFT